MATIRVIGPPKEAFNKHRAISDLLAAQIKHFRHIEDKLDESLRTNFALHEITTENAAAQYIAQMTDILRSVVSEASTPPIPISKPKPKLSTPTKRLALAAAADPAPAQKSLTKKTSTKKHATPHPTPKRKKP
jgi:hypothetical protein